MGRQNLKMIVLTNPGERMMDPDFGVGIRQYLFELENLGIQQDIITNIHTQTNKYLNSVQVLDIRFTDGSSTPADAISIANSNAIYVQILFKILPLDSVNVLSLPLIT